MNETQEADPFDTVTFPIEKFGVFLWTLGVVCGILSIFLQNGGLITGSLFTWWPSSNYLQYYVLISVWLIALIIFLYFATKTYSKNLATFGLVSALLAAVLWIASYPSFTYSIVLSVLMFEVSALLIGVVLFTIGLIYITRQEGYRILTYITGFSFFIAGGFGIVVGYVAGFTPFLFPSLFEIPWIFTVAILPSAFGIIYSLDR